ncbi:hypothetical protein WEI85_40770 [Actinomycetes bacterium KLBMP 9797]
MTNPPDDPLVAELRALGTRLDVPEAPDLRTAVRERLAAPHPVRANSARSNPVRANPARWKRRWLAAVTAAAVCAAVALSPARSAVADAVGGLLNFAGIEVRRGPERGELPTPSPLPSVRDVPLDEARRLARFPVLVPDRLGAPERVSVADPLPDGAPRVVSLFYRGGTVRLDEFDGQLKPTFLKESARDAEWVEFEGGQGLWFSGPHAVTYLDRTGAERVATARLAGPTLIWADRATTVRLEGVPTRAEALAIAASS